MAARSASNGTGKSITARAQPWDSLPTVSMAPLRMCHTMPFTSRTRVIRSVTFSTVPVASPTVITSPTPYWSSTSMKTPDR